MKIIKKVLIAILVTVIVTLFVCFIVYAINCLKFYRYLELRPTGQDNTVWSSENGQITIYVGEGNRGEVVFHKNDSEIRCFFTSDVGYEAYIYPLNYLELYGLLPAEHLEKWTYSNIEKDSFEITVEETTYLESGQVIKFKKIREG